MVRPLKQKLLITEEKKGRKIKKADQQQRVRETEKIKNSGRQVKGACDEDEMINDDDDNDEDEDEM